jgi:hypothetical protein
LAVFGANDTKSQAREGYEGTRIVIYVPWSGEECAHYNRGLDAELSVPSVDLAAVHNPSKMPLRDTQGQKWIVNTWDSQR